MMNELYCLNEMSSDIDKMSRSLWYIYDEFLIPIWIIAIAAIIAVTVWVVLGVFSAITLVKLQRKMMAETAMITKEDYRRYIRKAERKAKRLVNEYKNHDEDVLKEMIQTVAKDKKPIKVEDVL